MSQQEMIPERSENANFGLISKLKVLNEDLYGRMKWYYNNPDGTPRVILGRKGNGKTFAGMKSISDEIASNPDFLPVVYSYDRDSHFLRIMPWDRLASEDIWGKERMEILHDKPKLISKSNLMFLNDIHYMCDDASKGIADIDSLSNLLEVGANRLKEGKSVLVTTEYPLSYYSKSLKNDKFDQTIRAYGFRNLEKGTGPENESDAMAILEIPAPNFSITRKFFDASNLTADDATAFYMYATRPNFRYYTRFCNFIGKDTITIKDVTQKAMELLPKSKNLLGNTAYNLYNIVLSLENPEIDNNTMKYFSNAEEDFLQLDKLIEEAYPGAGKDFVFKVMSTMAKPNEKMSDDEKELHMDAFRKTTRIINKNLEGEFVLHYLAKIGIKLGLNYKELSETMHLFSVCLPPFRRKQTHPLFDPLYFPSSDELTDGGSFVIKKGRESILDTLYEYLNSQTYIRLNSDRYIQWGTYMPFTPIYNTLDPFLSADPESIGGKPRDWALDNRNFYE